MADRRAPQRVRALLRTLRRHQRKLTAWPPVGRVDWGSLDRTKPISEVFGWDRGTPIDRVYIDDFLTRHAKSAVAGRVLEVGEDRYASRLAADGGHAVERLDIVDIDPANPVATVHADLANAPGLASDTYDCVICTQTLLLIYDVQAAVATLHRILKPGGTVFATVPSISRACGPDLGVEADYWRFTSRSARRLFEQPFPRERVTVESYGNVQAAVAFLHGLAAEEIEGDRLMERDPSFELLIGVKATKPA